MPKITPPDEAAINAKIKESGGGLSREQAVAVLTAQAEHDAALAEEEGAKAPKAKEPKAEAAGNKAKVKDKDKEEDKAGA